MTDENTAAKAAFLPGANSRAKIIPLAWPIVFGGIEYREIQLVRLTAGEVAAWQKEIAALPDDATTRLPIFRDVNGAPIPDGVMDGLDDDDAVALDEAALAFMPRRFRAAPASDTALPDGAPIAPLSAASSDGA